jgi:hypothetical protein
MKSWNPNGYPAFLFYDYYGNGIAEARSDGVLLRIPLSSGVMESGCVI